MNRPVVHVVGARPNFVKAAPVLRALAARGVEQRLVHTGQHYDARMSDVFFTDLALPAPDVNLEVGSGSHARQTAALLVKLEECFDALDPALVVVYGDVNSTLAAALVAAKTGRPLAHVEAGLRSFDPAMPEEVNRRVTDVLADVHLVTSPEALAHLAREGVPADRMHLVGNPMIDTLLANLERFDAARVASALGLAGAYAVATVHRPANVDDPKAARRLVEALHGTARLLPVVLPLHPRGREQLAAAGLFTSGNGVRVVDPLGYVDCLSLVRGARLVLTDSGGLQEETTVLRVPCLTIRTTTERPVTITHGTNRLVAPEDVPALAEQLLAEPGTALSEAAPEGPPLWDGRSGERIAAVLARFATPA